MIDKNDDLNDQRDVPLPELLNASFLSNHSSFSSISELMEASGFKIESQEDFEAIPDKDWDAFINKNTSFENWKGMLNAACEEWIKQKADTTS